MSNFSINSSVFNVTLDNDNNSSEPNTFFSFGFEYITGYYVYQYGKYMTGSMAVITNILVVATVIRCWTRWKHSTGLIILTLACSDLINNIINIMWRLNYNGHVIWAMFLLLLYISSTLSGLSNFIMTLISLNRYALVCKPFRHLKLMMNSLKYILLLYIVCFHIFYQSWFQWC